MKRRANDLPNRGWILCTMMVFLTTAFSAIIVNSLIGHGMDVSRTISRYVGFEVWSAVFFAVGNCFVAAMMAVYLWQVGEAWKMPRVFYYTVLVMAVALIWLSVCPTGMCDVAGQKSLVSLVHEVTSKTMFVTMMLTSLMVVLCKKASSLAHGVNVAFVVYAMFCVVGVLTRASWFESLAMIYETLYIALFMMVMAFCDSRERVPKATSTS